MTIKQSLPIFPVQQLGFEYIKICTLAEYGHEKHGQLNLRYACSVFVTSVVHLDSKIESVQHVFIQSSIY